MVSVKTLNDAISVQQVDGETQTLPPQVIKSAGRALQILELFDVLQRPACVTEIATLLKYPQSSASMLLRSLVEMGYLRHDAHSRAYVPSSRVALLGKWVSADLVRDGSVTGLMRHIHDHTGQAVILGSRQGMLARYSYVIQARESKQAFIVQGSVRSILQSSVGTILLAGTADADVRRLIIRYNAEGGDDGQLIATADVFVKVEAARADGFAFEHCRETKGMGVLAIPLQPEIAPDAKGVSAIAVAGNYEFLETRKDELLEIMKSYDF